MSAPPEGDPGSLISSRTRAQTGTITTPTIDATAKPKKLGVLGESLISSLQKIKHDVNKDVFIHGTVRRVGRRA